VEEQRVLKEHEKEQEEERRVPEGHAMEQEEQQRAMGGHEMEQGPGETVQERQETMEQSMISPEVANDSTWARSAETMKRNDEHRGR
jgi:hypothetical protein